MSFAHNHNLTTSTAYTAKHLLRSEKVQTTLLNHLGSSQLRVRVHVRERVKKKKSGLRVVLLTSLSATP